MSDALLSPFRSAGISPDDSAELQLKKSLLMLATGLVCVMSMLWLFIYWQAGPAVLDDRPLRLPAAARRQHGDLPEDAEFRPFSAIPSSAFFCSCPSWRSGASAISSRPAASACGAARPDRCHLFCGVRESIAWFAAYIFMTALSGFFDFYLADTMLKSSANAVPIRTSVFFFVLNFIAVSSIVHLLLRFSTLEKEKAAQRLDEAHRLLQIEQERSEKLLLNILPGSIAERLKNSSQTIADGFADVTVMFADIVNFTRVAEGLTPQQVFAMLNRIFSSFDELAEKYGMEKIKTIGDAYMVAGGLNSEFSDYTAAIADMAADMRDLLHRDFNVNQMHLEVRIGIGTGPVVAGVVGKKSSFTTSGATP